MKIETTRFGTVEIDPDAIISFTRAMPGFPDGNRYVLLPHREDSPFYWLQSIENPELAFLVINPFSVTNEYSYEIPDSVQEELGIRQAESVQTLVLVTVRKDGDNPSVTANMLGPVVINSENMKARQIVLDPNNYDVQYRL